MGIDITIESTIDFKWNESLGSFANCKWAWSEADIDWETVFEIINFKPTLLFDNEPNFWTWEQLAVVLANLIKLSVNPEYYTHEYSGWNLNDVKTLKPSIDKLIELFTEYVGKKCRLVIS